MKHIKSLFISLIALCAISGVAFSATNVPTDVGMLKRQEGTSQDTPVRVYKLVRYATEGANQASLNSGDAVTWDQLSLDGLTVRIGTNSLDGGFAGIVAATILTYDTLTQGGTTAGDDNGRRNWGYITVNGGPVFANITAGGTNGNAYGDIVILSNDAGKVTTIISLDSASALGTAGSGTVSDRLKTLIKQVGNKGGIFLSSADGTSTKTKVYLQLE